MCEMSSESVKIMITSLKCTKLLTMKSFAGSAEPVGEVGNYPLDFGRFKQNLFHQINLDLCLTTPTQIFRASVVSNVA